MSNSQYEIELVGDDGERGGRGALAFVGGLAVGAALMYFLDPDRGTRRRAIVHDKAVHYGRASRERLDEVTSRVGNRARGVTAEARRRLSREQVTDEVLVSRVRAELGRIVARPRGITVAARNGWVTLDGSVAPRELEQVLGRVRRVRGVRTVVNRLECDGMGEHELGADATAAQIPA